MPVTYTFGSATTAIPLSQLDTNFATPITLGNAAIQLGNTVTTLGNVTIAGSTLSSVNIAGGSANGVVYLNTSNVATANASVLALDGNGNLGLGTTPSAWGSGRLAIEMNSSVAAYIVNNNTGSLQLQNNSYYNGSVNVAKVTGAGSAYSQYGGSHVWYSMASVSAGATQTFTQAMTLDSSSNLFIGTTVQPSTSVSGIVLNDTVSGGTVFSSGGTTTAWNHFTFKNGNGSVGVIQTNGSATLFTSLSDRRLKTNIASITTAQSGPIIDALQPRSFNWISDNSADVGFIADEVQAIIPKAVTGQPNETTTEEYEVTPAVKDEHGNITTPAVMGTRTVPVYQMIDMSQSEIIAYLVSEVQSLRKRVAALETKVGV